MKVVLFCGGYGMRMRRHDGDLVPKPMQLVGPRPLLWHVMRYYAHFGHKEFILCLGHGAQWIKNFFLEYSETDSNDFVLEQGKVSLTTTDIADWTIHFVDTGLESAIGERLRRVRHLLDPGEMFLANYADVLTDANLDEIVERFTDSGLLASMLVVAPQSSFHCVNVDGESRVTGITPVSALDVWENGGYFVLKPEVIDLIPEGGDLVGDACEALAEQNQLFAYQHKGFWKPADTFKERAELEERYHRGDRPWALWETS